MRVGYGLHQHMKTKDQSPLVNSAETWMPFMTKSFVPCPRKVVFSSMQLLKNQHHHTNPSNPNPTMT